MQRRPRAHPVPAARAAVGAADEIPAGRSIGVGVGVQGFKSLRGGRKQKAAVTRCEREAGMAGNRAGVVGAAAARAVAGKALGRGQVRAPPRRGPRLARGAN